MYILYKKKPLIFTTLLGLVLFLFLAKNANAGPFEDLENELDELNAAGNGYQGLLDDLDAAANESPQSTKPIVVSSEGDNSGLDGPASDSENKDNSKEFNSGDLKVSSPVPGIYSFTCKNGTRGTLNSSSILTPGSASKAVSQFERYVENSINSACGDASVQSTGAINWVFGKVRSWVKEKHKTCLKKYPYNPNRCNGYKKRSPGWGVRG